MGTHVKIHVSPLLDRAKIEAKRAPKFFGSGLQTGCTGLRRSRIYVHCFIRDNNDSWATVGVDSWPLPLNVQTWVRVSE
jgi:hypothetical protein